MSSLIQTTTPLGSGGSFVSSAQQTTRATQITGSVFADQAGTLYIEQGGDGTNWDNVTEIAVEANIGTSIEIDVTNQFIRARFLNGASAQATFRLYVDLRDPYGAFLLPASGPSPGGAYAVLFDDPARGYQFVGRFDGIDGWNANGNAAIAAGRGGKYASFLVANAIVSDEVLMTVSEHGPDVF